LGIVSWTEDTRDSIAQVLSSTQEKLLLCSPFLSRQGLDFVSENLPEPVSEVEIWTKLEMRDWITGASDAEALADFWDEQAAERSVVVRTSAKLHAKLFLGDGGMAAAGSANLTFGGLSRNVEILRLVSGSEVKQIQEYVTRVRPLLAQTERDHLEHFLAECKLKKKDQLALVAIIKEYSAAPAGPGPLLIVEALEQFCAAHPAFLTDRALAISTGQDKTNRTGHIHQAFFAAQRFFQEYPGFLGLMAEVGLDADFDPSTVPGFVEAWEVFLDSHPNEVGDAPTYPYAFASLKRHLTDAFGGTRTGGGGWNPPFRIVWPIVARMMQP
jgi:hypothetical protein